jgi:L-ribulokinase
MTSSYSIGLDFGTNSCRALLVDLANGQETATAVFDYPSGQAGVMVDARDPNLARQNPADYLLGIETTIRSVLQQAAAQVPGFQPGQVIAIGVDTTGSTPIPVNAEGTALGLLDAFRNNPHAMVWLWKDHTSHAEAEEITELAARIRPEYLARIGGRYSSEWFWSKILRCRRVAPEVFQAAASWVELCDWVPAVLTGTQRPDRSICSAGHKAMFNPAWGGLPDETFLTTLHPDLAALRSRLYSEAFVADEKAGSLTAEWALKLGLPEGITVAVGAFDAHMGAVGAGIREGALVKIMGTSTCDVTMVPSDRPLADIPGVCGIVDGSVLSGFFGIEAGQSAVGDIFLWFLRNLVPDSWGSNTDEKFRNLSARASEQKPGEHGLLALDWNNGNRTILVDVRLTGLLLGQTLHTEAHEIYRALIEATAFGALAIIDRIEEHGVAIREVINCGGLAVKSPLIMQIYADVTGRPMKIANSDQTPALGAAIFGALAAGSQNGGFDSPLEAQGQLCGIRTTYEPNPEAHAVYRELYGLYRQLHDGFGTPQWSGSMANVMKELLAIRDRQRSSEMK